MSIYRTVHTGLFSQKTKDIITAVLKEASAMSRNSYKAQYTAAYANVNFEPNNEIVLQFDDNMISSHKLVSYIRIENDVISRRWLAWQLKNVIYDELDSRADYKHKAWKRSNTDKSSVLSDASKCQDVTFNEVYCIYDILMGRKNIDRHYSEQLIEDVRGVERDPFATEMEVQHRKALEVVKTEYSKKINAANVEYYFSAAHNMMRNKLDEIQKEADRKKAECRKEFFDKSKKDISILRAELNKKIAEIENQFSMLLPA